MEEKINRVIFSYHLHTIGRQHQKHEGNNGSFSLIKHNIPENFFFFLPKLYEVITVATG